MTSGSPAVSVIIPTHQRRELVKRAVASVLAQTYRDFELIVVDDGSTDGTREALASLGGRLRYEWQPNGGAAAARNAGLRLARGSIVALLDSDDLWLRRHLETVAAILDRHHDAVLAFTRPPPRWSGRLRAKPRVIKSPLSELMVGNIVGLLSAVALRREAALGVGGFDERLEFVEDADLWLRLAVGGGDFVWLPRRTVVHREIASNSLIDNRAPGKYAEDLKLGTVRVIGELERDGPGVGVEPLNLARGRLRFLDALAALDHGDDRRLREALEDACRMLPRLNSFWVAVLNHVRFSLPGQAERVEEAHRLARFARLWPERDSPTATLLSAHAVLALLGARCVDQVRELVGALPRREITPILRALPRALRRRSRVALRGVGNRARRVRSEPLGLRLTTLGHRAMLRTERGPLRPAWRLAYELIARVAGHYLVRSERGTVYVKGTLAEGDPVYGLSDIDMVAVLPGDPGEAGIARMRAKRRWQRLRRRLPAVHLLFEPPEIYEEDELAAVLAQSTFTHGLDPDSSSVDDPVRPSSRERRRERDGAERPGPLGPASDWRRLSGAERRPIRQEPSRDERRLAAWTELQFWWLTAFRACAAPNAHWVPYATVKLIAEPARILLWLVDGERIRGRREVLERALLLLPEEEKALRAALALGEHLREVREAPLGDALSPMLRISARLARSLREEVEEAGTTEVRLCWGESRELVLSAGAKAPLVQIADGGGPLEVLPLVDWRARVWSSPPDEGFAFVDRNPSDPVDLAAAALSGDGALYPALRADGLLILPSLKRARLRAIQCPPADPVSFALAAGEDRATFPNVPGWSAQDSARRAAAEHLGWLRGEDRDPEPTRENLGRLFTAARAAHLLKSIREGETELDLTAEAIAGRMAERPGIGRPLAEDALAELRFGADGAPPSSVVVAALAKGVGAAFEELSSETASASVSGFGAQR